MSGFNLAEMLQKAGVNIDTDDKMQVEHISIDLIVPDENNFYELSGLDELAASIALCGLQQPLLVRPMPGDESQVIITSGHRRHAALKMLIEQDGREDLRDVPCIVGPADENPKLTQLKLIMANSTARKISSSDLAKQAEQIEQLLCELKEDGMEFPGRMRDHVAQACNVSTGKLARLRVIRSGLIPDLKKLWESGNLADITAYEYARISADDQELISKSKHVSGWHRSSTVASMEKSFTELRENTCSHEPSGKCINAPLMINKICNTAQYSYCSCSSVKCCLKCDSLERCGSFCAHAADRKAKLKESTRAANEVEKIREKERTEPVLKFTETVYSRILDACKTADISVEAVEKAMKMFPAATDGKIWAERASGIGVKLSTDLPFGYGANTTSFMKLVSCAEALGCSTDYLLGREAHEEKPAQQAAPAGWNTGEPKEPGYYVCRYTLIPDPEPQYDTFWWGGKRWTRLDGREEITHWMPAPEVDT